MLNKDVFGTPIWSFVLPIAACLLLAVVWDRPLGWVLLGVVVLALFASVFAAVHHAEVIALRVGEPFGTLVLALAVTVIEASLIVALMLAGGEATSELARDTVFATVMIICNGVVGLCLLLGTLRHRVLEFRVEGTSPAFAVLATLATLTLVLPSFTVTEPGPKFSPSQLIFAGVVSLALYGVFVFVQTVRHREHFLPVEGEIREARPKPPPVAVARTSFGLLMLALVAVVGLAKSLSPSIAEAVENASVPHTVVGIAIALLVLLPETWAATRAALRDSMQTSFNLAFGSALATIGLTIPVVAVVSLTLDLRLVLGLDDTQIAILALTLLITAMTVSRGRATVLQGAVHLVLFAVFLFLAVVP